MKQIKLHIGHNSKGRELRYEIKEKEDGSAKPFVLVSPGQFDRSFKTLKSAEKAFNKKVA